MLTITGPVRDHLHAEKGHVLMNSKKSGVWVSLDNPHVFLIKDVPSHCVIISGSFIFTKSLGLWSDQRFVPTSEAIMIRGEVKDHAG